MNPEASQSKIDPCKRHSENVFHRSHYTLQRQREFPKVLCIHCIFCTIHAIRVLELKMKSILNVHTICSFRSLAIAYHVKCSMVAKFVLDQQAPN